MAIKIFIDQGHNPQNPNAGAEGNGLREQDLVFRIGLELAGYLASDERFSVLLSRPEETTQLGNSISTSLQTRVREANDWGADYFISLHANASSVESASWSEGFAYAQPSKAFAFGETILPELQKQTGIPTRGMSTRTNLYVLRRTAMPAVLLELGFITNPGDAALMRDRPDLFARGIYNGILRYFGFAVGD